MIKKYKFLTFSIIIVIFVLSGCGNNEEILKTTNIKVDLLDNGSGKLGVEEKIPETAIQFDNKFDEKGILVKTFLDKIGEETVVYILMIHSSSFKDSKILSLEQKGQKLNIGVDIPEPSGLFSIQKFLYKIEFKEKITEVAVKEVKNKKVGNSLIYKYENLGIKKNGDDGNIPKSAIVLGNKKNEENNYTAYLEEKNGQTIVYLRAHSYLKVLNIDRNGDNLKIKTVIEPSKQKNDTIYFFSKLVFPGKIVNIEIEETKE
jgi:hypothetical protein